MIMKILGRLPTDCLVHREYVRVEFVRVCRSKIDISADTALLSLKQRWRFLKWDAVVSHAWLRFRRDWGQHPHDLIKACSSFGDVIQNLPLHLGQLQPHEVHHHGLKQALSLYAIPRLGQELSKPRPDPILLVIVHALRAKESTGIDPLDFTAMSDPEQMSMQMDISTMCPGYNAGTGCPGSRPSLNTTSGRR
jgi:hypothetical protein